MNCRRNEKLIPLYVEGDLDDEQAGAVLSHAKSCAKCTAVIDEYKESQRWLRSFAPPHFDDALLDDLKRGVLKEINVQEAQASFLNRLAEHWTRRLILAASAAVLIICGALTFYIYQRNANEAAIAEGEIKQEDRSPEIAAKPKDVKTAPRASFTVKRHRKIISARFSEATARRDTVQELIIKRPEKASVEPAVAIETGDGLSSDPATPKDVLRIEIQTSDPSIRIIWFSPKENNSNPSKPITETE